MTFPGRPSGHAFFAVLIAALLAIASCGGGERSVALSHAPALPGKLTGRLLVASPKMPDPRFAKTVILIVRHDDHGAMGFVINRPIGTGPAAKLLRRLKRDSGDIAGDGRIRLHYGGPVQPARGFVLHSSDYARDGTVIVTDDVSMTANYEILRAIATGNGPRQGFMAMGFAGWSAGQLEREIGSRDWVTVATDRKLVFDLDMPSKWRRALAKQGIDL